MSGSQIYRNNFLVDVTIFLSRCYFFPYYRLTIQGLDHLPRDRGYVLLPKHQCWQDIPLLGIAAGRPLFYMAKSELFKNPISNWYISSLGGVPLNRKNPLESRKHLRSMIQYIQDGEGVVVFPEGTYFRNKMGPGKKGLLRLIISRSPTTLIPVGIRYSGKKRATDVTIRFGSPIDMNTDKDFPDIMKTVMSDIRKLSGL